MDTFKAKLILGSVLNLTKVPRIKTPPSITIALIAALASTPTSVPTLAPTSNLYTHAYTYGLPLAYRSILSPKRTVKAKLIPKNDTGGGNGI